MRMLAELLGHALQQLQLDLERVLAWRQAVRLPTRKMCVSTAMVASPNATFITTFAVLRPTRAVPSVPRGCAAPRQPCFSIKSRLSAMTFLAFMRNRADGLDVAMSFLLAERHHRRSLDLLE